MIAMEQGRQPRVRVALAPARCHSGRRLWKPRLIYFQDHLFFDLNFNCFSFKGLGTDCAQVLLIFPKIKMDKISIQSRFVH